MKIYRKITKAELSEYLEFSYDQNSLHLGNKPIIPGNLLLFILEKLYKKTFSKRLYYIKIKFLTPAYLGEALQICYNEDCFEIKGATNKTILEGTWSNE